MVVNSKVHLATNVQGRVIKIMALDITKVDCKIAFSLMKDIKTDILIADRAYNNGILSNMSKITALKLLFI